MTVSVIRRSLGVIRLRFSSWLRKVQDSLSFAKLRDLGALLAPSHRTSFMLGYIFMQFPQLLLYAPPSF